MAIALEVLRIWAAAIDTRDVNSVVGIHFNLLLFVYSSMVEEHAISQWCMWLGSAAQSLCVRRCDPVKLAICSKKGKSREKQNRYFSVCAKMRPSVIDYLNN